METLIFKKTGILRREKDNLEQQLKVTITLSGKSVTIEGNPLDEYIASFVLEALTLGFSLKEALLLKDENISFRKLQIRDFTRRKNIWDVRARLIGTEGKTRRTLEEISDCIVVINENTVGLIGPANNIDNAVQAVINIIKGSKQSNVYRYLERMNAEQKKQEKGLGIKIKNKK